MKSRGPSFYVFILTVLLLIGPHMVTGASDDEAPIVGCSIPNFGCNDPIGPTETPESTCKLVSANLNDQELDAGDPLTVSPGESIIGTVTLETYNAGSSGDTAPLAATPNYGDHKTSFWGISTNIPTDEATFVVDVSLTAPEDDGIYYIFFAWYWEKTYENVMSLTNWQHPEGDVWDDDVNIADWTDYQAQQGIDNGWVETEYLNKEGEYDENVVYPGTAVRIEVQGP